jgi:6-pyruvoyltetrahydropterin/6-carboxytetrahydropterin synthase
MENKVSVFRREHFNAAHRLFVAEWDDDKNQEVFGKCSNPNYHGHNYDLEVKITGIPDPKTGYVIDLKKLSNIIRSQVLEQFDHRNLNLDTPFFRELNPTAENIAVVIYGLLRKHISPALDLRVRLYETDRNFVEYPA